MAPPHRAPESDFNPRAYVRHDHLLREEVEGSLFQSTCLREARHSWFPIPAPTGYFNPRAYVRHDRR